MDFKTLKRNKKNGNINNLVAELDKMKNGGGKYTKDERFWSTPIDEKTGNGTALIRYLPACGKSELEWVTIFSHAFQGPGGWYIENSLTTLGQTDPVSQHNSELWATGTEANKEVVRKRKRKQHFISNILVLSDPKNPENEGKVFLFKYGKKIFEKISEKIKPEFEGDVAIDPFDFWNGANFRIKVKKVDGYPNYDSSYFESPTPLLNGDDAALEKIYQSQYDLTEFHDPKNFKSYEELKARFEKVIGKISGTTTNSEDNLVSKPKASNRPKFTNKEESAEDLPWNSVEESYTKNSEVKDDDNEDLSDFLKKLADDGSDDESNNGLCY